MNLENWDVCKFPLSTCNNFRGIQYYYKGAKKMEIKRPTRRLFQHFRFKLKKDITRIMAKKKKSKNPRGTLLGEKLNLIISNEIHGPA